MRTLFLNCNLNEITNSHHTGTHKISGLNPRLNEVNYFDTSKSIIQITAQHLIARTMTYLTNIASFKLLFDIPSGLN